MFFQDAFLGTLFLLFFMLILYENNRLGDPFKIQCAPKWLPKSIKWQQMVQQMPLFFCRLWKVLFATCFLKALWAPPLRILDRFGLISDSMLFDFAFRWTRFGKALPSRLGLVKMGRRNSRRDNNLQKWNLKATWNRNWKEIISRNVKDIKKLWLKEFIRRSV